jgi:hypothetical protein
MKIPFRLPLALLALPALSTAQAPLYDFYGVAGSSFGHGLSSVGDMDGDGKNDILVGAPTGDGLQTSSGVAMVLSSVTTLPIRTFQGEHTGDRFGHSVAGIGDLTGDGISEIAVGAPQNEPSGGNNRGAVYILNGATGAQLAKHVGLFDNDKLGWCVTALGDVNTDGLPDYAYSAPYGDSIIGGADLGFVWINSGASLASIQVYFGEAAGDLFGYSIDGIGDLTGDGKADVIAGAPEYNLGAVADSGRAYVLSSGTNSRINWISGGIPQGNLGFSVSELPDLNFDGKSEVLVGEPGWNGAGANTGRVQAVSGAGGSILKIYTNYSGGTAGDRFGWAVAGLHDVDNDSRGDLMIGAIGWDSAPLIEVGGAFLISGNSGAVIGGASGYSNADYMGYTVANGGDLNGDGFDDALMAAPTSSGAYAGGGWARAHLGGVPAPTGYCTAKVNSQGCTPWISYGGAASMSLGNGIALVGQNVRPNLPGLMIWSVNAAATPFFGGTLCLGAPVRRTPGQLATTLAVGFPCTGQYYFLFSKAYMAQNNLTPGQDVHAQWWSRDNGFAAPNNVGLTGGLKFTIAP